MPRKKKSEIVVEEVIEPMKEDAMNPPVDNAENEKSVESENHLENNSENSPSSLSSEPVKMRIRSSSNLVNVRQEPNGEVLFRLQNGSPILVEPFDDKWVKISGYVMKELIGEF